MGLCGIIVMAEVREIKIDGYKSFFVYIGFRIIVYVNKQNQFKAGQKNVGSERYTLTEPQAKEARTLEAPKVKGILNRTPYRDSLKINGFDLEKE